MTITIYHNPKCSNSRGCLAILRERGIEPRVVEYLKMPLSAAQLKALAQKAGLSAREMIRTKEPIYAELELDNADEDRLFKAMAENPILMNRPIVETEERAMLCRPPEAVRQLL